MHRLALLLLVSGYVHEVRATRTPEPNGTYAFLETFDEPFEGRWIVSSSPEYQGTWGWEPSDDFPLSTDRGLVVNNEARRSAISVEFGAPFAFQEGKALVIQYEVKLQNSLMCGGAYIKLLSKEGVDADPFDNNSPYVIMFGPDRCAQTDRCHFILRYRNPVTKDLDEKAATMPPTVPGDRRTHVYTLALYSNDTFEMFIDFESRLSGSLLEDMEPPINPPAEIDDPTDLKPEDWVDEAEMPDPEAVKPDDWDESQPAEIPDLEAIKPDDWDEAAPREIPDPEATAPEDWVEAEDGVWEAPMVPNPACPEGKCGPWSPPMIANPKYKGKWSPPMIPNPSYKGPWKARQIPNPNFYEDKHPVANLEPIHGVGIEIWSMQSGMLFDNFLLTHDLDTAFEFARATWEVKYQQELEAERKSMGWAEWVGSNPMIFWGVCVASVLLMPLGLWFFCGRGPIDDPATEDYKDENDADDDADSKDNRSGRTKESEAEGLRQRAPHTAE